MNITKQEIKNRLEEQYPHGLELIYIDYRDSLDEHKEALEELAQTGYADSLFERVDDWGEFESIDYIFGEIFTEEERDYINEVGDLKQDFQDLCFEMDKSEPLKQLMKNTSRQFMYYDLDFEVEPAFSNNGFYNMPENNEKKQAKKIAKKLKIDYQKHEKELLELLGNASYGGQLVILFVAEVEDLRKEMRSKYITFKSGYEICIMDRGNGSGYSLPIDETLSFKFIDENLHNDEGASGYSYSGDVCGMIKWEESVWTFSNKAQKAISVKRNEEAEARDKQEKEYQKRYDSGKCTFGDMKYSRHRNTEYINNYPCGNKCKDCGTFWID